MHGDARVGDRAPRQGEAGAPAQAGEVPRSQVGRGLRLARRRVPRRLGPRRDALAGVRARRGGPGLLRPDGARQDPHGHRPRNRRDLGGLPREVLADRAAGAAARQGQAGGDARPAARRRGQGEAPGPGRVRLRALRRGRGEAPVPGHIGQLREEEAVFTTNVEFSRWGTVFADDKLAAAIVDRVVHHGRLVEFGGPSHRLEGVSHAGKVGK